MHKLAIAKEKLTRPELAVLLSYSKMTFYHQLQNTKIAKEPFFEKILLDYFPKAMQQKFKNEILNHQLREEIILTVITNDIVNKLNGVILNNIRNETAALACDIARSYAVTCELFNVNKLWQEVEALGHDIQHETKIAMFSEINKVIRRGVFWFIRNLEHPISIDKVISSYQNKVSAFTKNITKYITKAANEKIKIKAQSFKDAGINASLGNNIAKLDILISGFDISHLSNKTGEEFEDIARLYFAVGNKFFIDWLRKWCDHLLTEAYWNRLALQSLKDDLYNKQRELVLTLAKAGGANIIIEDWLHKNQEHVKIYFNFIEDLKAQETLDMNMVTLAIKKLNILLQHF